MWNDTDIPLAVFFTFRCYGTWLHGDERGAVDRHNNIYKNPRILANDNCQKFNEKQLKFPAVKLNAAERKSVERAIGETCEKRRWSLLALNVRTNHVHAVIAIGSNGAESALIALKANATRHLREDRLWNHGHTPWAKKGSKRKLWNEKSIWEATNYVLNGQGDELPDFDWW
jgi:REP element-mobilizing transposase RayT